VIWLPREVSSKDEVLNAVACVAPRPVVDVVPVVPVLPVAVEVVVPVGPMVDDVAVVPAGVAFPGLPPPVWARPIPAVEAVTTAVSRARRTIRMAGLGVAARIEGTLPIVSSLPWERDEKDFREARSWTCPDRRRRSRSKSGSSPRNRAAASSPSD